MNKEEIQKLFKDNHIKVIRYGDIEIPVEYLKQTTVNVNGDDYIKLQQENKRLKIQVSAREEVANKYKDVIEEVREYIEDWLFNVGGNGASMTYEDINELLQILDKGVDK